MEYETPKQRYRYTDSEIVLIDHFLSECTTGYNYVFDVCRYNCPSP